MVGCGLVLALASAGVAEAGPPRWRTLSPPPPMPAPDAVGDLAIDDFTLHWAAYGDAARPAVVLLHGGLGSGDDFAAQVPALAAELRVIVVDSRGQGRSTRSKAGVGYHAMAEDVVALLDALKIERTAVVGWSDGGIIALDLAIHHPARNDRIVVTGTHFDRGGTKAAGKSPTVTAYFARGAKEHKRQSPAPGQLPAVRKDLRAMWKREPAFTAAELGGIESALLVLHGEHDEIIRRGHVERLAALVPQARLVVLPDASHFAMWQDPARFNREVLGFLMPPP